MDNVSINILSVYFICDLVPLKFIIFVKEIDLMKLLDTETFVLTLKRVVGQLYGFVWQLLE